MPRPTGWSVLAEKALELAALALTVRFMDVRRVGDASVCHVGEVHGGTSPGNHPEESKGPENAAIPQDDDSAPYDSFEPLRFIRESADPETRFFRASDDQVELLVAFFSDGRIRVADSGDRRFAGMLTQEKGDLLDIGSNEWSRVFVRATPEGKTQLELHGGPYDTHVLTCEPLEK